MSEVISSTTGVWAGAPHYGTQAGDNFGYSIALNFTGTRLAVGAPGCNSETGYVYVSDYDEISNTWTQVGSNIVGPHTYSRFGNSIDINWTGDRIIVGANTCSNVYVYDYSTNWAMTHVIDTSISSFGHCISLANDISSRLCVGAPDVNTIYVYEERSGSWDLDFSNVGTDFENVTPLSYGRALPPFALSNLTYINVASSYSQYGYSVAMSAFGDHIVVGAPGTRLSQIDTTNSDATQIYQSNAYHSDNPVNIPDDCGSFQIGHSRVFKCPLNGDWTTGVTQVGQLLRGNPDGIQLNGWDPLKGTLPGFGFNSHISHDGTVLLIISVEQGVKDVTRDFERGHGRLQYYTYNGIDNIWELSQKIDGNHFSRSGWGSALSYDGGRIGKADFNIEMFSQVFDWNGSSFYDTGSPVSKIPGYGYLNQNLHGFDYAMVNGEFVAVSAPGFNTNVGSVHVFKYDLTAVYNGNSLFSGYIKTEGLYIGSNDNSLTDGTKRILFGGTNGDNYYECSTIESRVYDSIVSSEILIAKLPAIGGGNMEPDRVRIKAPNIILDVPRGDASGSESRYTENPVVIVTHNGNVGIGYDDTAKPSAHLDVKGDGYIKSKTSIGSYRQLDWRAFNDINLVASPNTDKTGCYLFYNTRDDTVLQGGIVNNTSFWYDRTTTMRGATSNVTHNTGLKSFTFTGATSNVLTDNYEGYNTANTDEYISLWVRFDSINTSYEQVLDLGGHTILSFKNDTVKLNVNGTDFTSSQTFANDTWYHIFIEINRLAGTSYTFKLYINTIQVITNSISPFSTSLLNRIIFGEGLNGNIGTPLFTYGFAAQEMGELYNYGPPDEVLAVGGGATIAGKLGVGVTNPTEALEVNGIIRNNNPRFYAHNNTGGSISTAGVANVFNLTYVNTGAHYNTSLSRFTAPVDGVYEFQFAALHRYVSGTGSSELSFAKNGTLISIRGISFTYVTAISDHDYNTADIMLELVKGDYIEPYIYSVQSGTDIYYGGGLAHFSGKFIG